MTQRNFQETLLAALDDTPRGVREIARRAGIAERYWRYVEAHLRQVLWAQGRAKLTDMGWVRVWSACWGERPP